jgi:hypothetical protein
VRNKATFLMWGSSNFVTIEVQDKEKLYYYRYNMNKENKLLMILIAKLKSELKKFMSKDENQDLIHEMIITNKNYVQNSYFIHHSEIPKEFDGYKLDISAAYWNEAKKIFLSEQTYSMGIPNKYIHKESYVDKIKKTRLHALGALAAVKFEKQYIDGELVSSVETESEFAFMFKYIANKITAICFDCVENYPELVGFWVDCFFWRNINKNKTADSFKSYFEFMYELKLKSEKCKFNKVAYMGSKYVYLDSLNVDTGETKRYFVS